MQEHIRNVIQALPTSPKISPTKGEKPSPQQSQHLLCSVMIFMNWLLFTDRILQAVPSKGSSCLLFVGSAPAHRGCPAGNSTLLHPYPSPLLTAFLVGGSAWCLLLRKSEAPDSRSGVRTEQPEGGSETPHSPHQPQVSKHIPRTGHTHHCSQPSGEGICFSSVSRAPGSKPAHRRDNSLLQHFFSPYQNTEATDYKYHRSPERDFG